MDSSGCVEQQGVIEEISDGKASVIFSNIAACGSCGAKSMCQLFGNSSRKIILPIKDQTFSIGETVNIVMKRSMGLKAAVFAYFVPFLLLILTLIIGGMRSWKEIYSALLSLAIISLYFIGLYFFRNRIKKAFNFNIQKIIRK